MKVQNAVYAIDADSGWERDQDVVWIIDEGNDADCADDIVSVIE